MSRSRSGLTATALAVAATTWVAMFSGAGSAWCPGSTSGRSSCSASSSPGPGRSRASVALARRRGRGVPAAGLGDGVQHVLSGSPVPVGEAWTRLVEVFSAASTSAERYALVPAHVPGVHPSSSPVGWPACCSSTCWPARCAGAARGLPLLTIYSVPVGMVGGGVTWWIFAPTAAGYLGILQEKASRWGRRSAWIRPSPTRPGSVSRPAPYAHTAGTIGTIATALAGGAARAHAQQLQVVRLRVGPGGDSDIVIENPMTDLRRDLTRGPDIPLLDEDQRPHPGVLGSRC